MRKRLGCLGLCCALILLGVEPPALAAGKSSEAATRAAARDLGSAGVQAFQAGDFATASEKLEAAYGVLRAPSLGLWSARALAKIGKWVEARERYVEVTRLDVSSGDEAIQKQAKADAATEGDALAQKLPRVVVQVAGAPAEEVTVTLDGEALPSALIGQARPVNPGAHHVEGVHGAEHVALDFTALEAQQASAALRFVQAGAGAVAPPPAAASVAPAAAPHKPMQRTLGYVAAAAGGAGILIGGVTGALVLSKKSSLDCANNLCPPSDRGDVDSYNSLRTVSTVSFVVGGVLAATGVVLVLTSKPSSESAALVLSPGSAAFKGSF